MTIAYQPRRSQILPADGFTVAAIVGSKASGKSFAAIAWAVGQAERGRTVVISGPDPARLQRDVKATLRKLFPDDRRRHDPIHAGGAYSTGSIRCAPVDELPFAVSGADGLVLEEVDRWAVPALPTVRTVVTARRAEGIPATLARDAHVLTLWLEDNAAHLDPAFLRTALADAPPRERKVVLPVYLESIEGQVAFVDPKGAEVSEPRPSGAHSPSIPNGRI